MQLSGVRLIYLHPSKTGGNSVTHALLPHSDDQLRVSGAQDGRHRFEIEGDITASKHAPLAHYRAKMGVEALAEYRVAMSVRDPLARAVSFYFSPHRWAAHGGRPVWDFDEFKAMLPAIARLSSFVRLGNALRRPDFVLRRTHLVNDLGAMATALQLPALKLPRVNSSAGTVWQRARVMEDPAVRRLVLERFAEDYVLLARWGFPSLPERNAVSLARRAVRWSAGLTRPRAAAAAPAGRPGPRSPRG